MGGVAVAVADLASTRGGTAEMHAGMVEAITEKKRLGTEDAAIEQSLEHRGVGLEAGGHDQRRGLLFQCRDLLFERRKQIEIAGDEARGAGARAVLLAQAAARSIRAGLKRNPR